MKKILLLVLLISCNKIIKLDNRNKDTNEKLLLAIEEDDENKVKKLISKGANINYISNGKTLLDIAINKANLRIAYLLLKNNINVDTQDKVIKIYDLALSDFNYKLIDIMIKKDYKIEEGVIHNDKYFLLLCYTSNAEKVEKFIKNNNVKPKEVKDKISRNGLIIASRRGDLDMVKLLLIYKIKVNSETICSWTALMSASQEGHIEIVKLLLEKGANVNYKEEDGLTALMLASQNGHIEVVNLLLKKGANVNDITKDEYTALMLASYNGYIEVVKLLIEKRANINYKNNDGLTALMLASQNGHIEVLNLLLEKGANINDIGKDEYTALILASKKDHREMIKLLFKREFMINEESIENMEKFLVSAANFGYRKGVELALEKGVDVNCRLWIKKKGYQTPLMIASDNGHIEVVRLLLEGGANVNCEIEGLMPLMLASKNGHLEIVKLLIEKGSKMNEFNHYIYTALMLASENGHKEIVETLIENSADLNKMSDTKSHTPLILALSAGHVEIAKLLIEKGAKLDIVAYKGYNALNLAIKSGYKEIVELLLEKGANINCKVYRDWTALMTASENGNNDLVKILLERGACIYDTNDKGFTALMISIKYNFKEIVELLLERGSHVEEIANDSYELTPLMLASKYGHIEVVKLLIEKGANINNKNYMNWSALVIALKYQNLGIVKLLLNKGALFPNNLKELKELIEVLTKNNKGKLIKEESQKKLLNELLYANEKLSIKSLLLIYKGALNFGEEILIKNIIENIDIANIYFLDNFTFSVKNLLIDCFLYLSESLKLAKSTNCVSELKSLIIRSFENYYENKDSNLEAAEEKLINDNNSIKVKIADFMVKIGNISDNLNTRELTNEELIKELNKE